MSHVLGRRWHHLKKIFQGYTSVLSVSKPAFHTSDSSNCVLNPDSNPANHTLKDVGKFYKIDNELSLNLLFKDANLAPDFIEECKTFEGTHFMIRKPALEVMNYLKHANYDYPINKYVLFGKRGHGVTTTMLHIVHYAYHSGWLVIHVPKRMYLYLSHIMGSPVMYWLTSNAERSASETKEGLIDLPLLGSNWLAHFKNQNLNLIKKLDLRIQNDYTWNIQEENKKGESLLSLVDQGITRGKYSCDVIEGLLNEVKLLSKQGIVKTLVAIDNFSVIFHPGRQSSNKKYKYLAPKQISFMESLKNMAKADWHNGAAVLSCHSEREVKNDIDHLPLNKLSREGFEFLDPFIPIEVPRLTDEEMTKALSFYRHNNWLSIGSETDLEIKTLSGGSISTLQSICGPL